MNFAEIKDGLVIRVLKFDGTELEGIDFLKSNLGGTWLLSTDENKASKGHELHSDGKFSLPKPFNSWGYDSKAGIYLPPLPRPIAVPVGHVWVWLEASGKWVANKVWKR